MQAIRLPFFSRGALGSSAVMSSRLSDATRFDAAAAAGRFASSVANAPQDSWEHVRFAVHHVGLRELALSNQTDVLGNVGVRRTGPLAIYNPMKVIRLGSIGRLHVSS